MKILLIFGFILLFSIYTFAKELPLAPQLLPVYQILKELPVNYKPEGAVCEQVAKLQAHESFPSKSFLVLIGVEYDVGAGTLGELDMVVLDKTTNQVQLVAEVKCWGSFDKALDKAKAQQDRFLWNLSQFPKKIQFQSQEEGLALASENFNGLRSFIFISQQGGVRKGFHHELPYTLNEMNELRAKLVRCQNKGTCSEPLP